MSKKVRAEVVSDAIITKSRYGLIVESTVVFTSNNMGDVVAFQRGYGRGIVCTIVNDDRD